MEFPDRQAFDKNRARLGSDDKETVGFSVIGSELREELVVRDAGRGGKRGFGADSRPDLLRDRVADGMPFRFCVTSR